MVVHPVSQTRLLKRTAVTLFYAVLAIVCVIAVAHSLGAGGFAAAGQALLQVEPRKIAEAVGCIAIVFAILWLLERATVKVAGAAGASTRKPWRALIANALSLGSGFGALSGGALRARLYAPFGIDTPTAFYIASLVTLASLMGGGIVAASALLLTDRMGFGHVGNVVGASALVAILVLIVLAGRDGRTLRIASASLVLPDRRQLAGLVAIGAADWVASAAVLYVLLPPTVQMPFATFVMLFTLSHYMAIATGTPGGLGVFDALLLTATAGQGHDASGVAAALVVYRIVGFVLPVGLAAFGLLLVEANAGGANGYAPRGAILHWVLQRLVPTPRHARAGSVTKGELFASATQQPAAALDDVCRRGPILILAPHPDDDVLGCGGLIAACVERGAPVHVAYLTDGRFSHLGSRQWNARRIAATRRLEAISAAAALGLSSASLTFADAMDGTLLLSTGARRRLVAMLSGIVAQHGIRRVFCTWGHDPHIDHVGAALIAEELRTQHPEVDLAFYPIWARLLPEQTRLRDGPWKVMRFELGRLAALKRTAVNAHRTQTTSLIGDALLTMPAPPYSKRADATDELFFVRER